MRFKLFVITGFVMLGPVLHLFADTGKNIHNGAAGFKTVEMPHMTLFFYLKPYNCPQWIADRLYKMIKKKMTGARYLDLHTQEKMQATSDPVRGETFDDYVLRSIDTAKSESVHRIIIGSVKRKKISYYAQRGSEGKEQYLLERKKTYLYTLSLEVVELSDNEQIWKKEINFRFGIDQKMMDNTIDELKGQFLPRIERIRIYPEMKFGLSLSGSYLLFMGQAKEISDRGMGLLIKSQWENIYESGSIVQFSAGFYRLNEEKSRIERYNLSQASITAGYSFSFLDFISKKLRFIPLAGFGYHLHHITSTNNGNELYADPFISAQYDISYTFDGNNGFVFSNGISCIIESDKPGLYTFLNIGIVRMF
jgi:hypothetical protein